MSKKKKLKNEKIVVIAGTYDPIDKDDLKLLKKAKKNYEWLIVGLHSDNFLIEYHGGYTLVS